MAAQALARSDEDDPRRAAAVSVAAAARGLAEAEVKNRFAPGDRLEFVLPGRNLAAEAKRIEDAEGRPLALVPGSGRRVWLPLPAGASAGEPCFVARFVCAWAGGGRGPSDPRAPRIRLPAAL